MKKVLLLLFLIFLACPIFIFADQIDINSATLSQLDKIVHVGAKTAQKIIDDRPYSSVQDLSRVKGIGDGRYLQDIIAQGFACINCTTEITETQNTDNTNQNLTDTTSQTTATPIVVQITYPGGIFINEILPNPEGSDETDEWIELYNSNSFDVDLSNWKIQDTEGTVATYIIPKDTKISANGFLVFKRPDTKIMLNNDKDGLNLLTPDGKNIDSIAFVSAPLGQSYNKIASGWAWSTALTPRATNIVTALAPKKTPSANSGANSLSKTNNSVKNNNIELGAADISQAVDLNKNSVTTNPWFLFFTALAATIILASIVLFIKLKLKKNVRT